MAIITQANRILFVGGDVAISTDCCCDNYEYEYCSSSSSSSLSSSSSSSSQSLVPCPADCSSCSISTLTISSVSGDPGGTCYTCSDAFQGVWSLTRNDCYWGTGVIDVSPFLDCTIGITCTDGFWRITPTAGCNGETLFDYRVPNVNGCPPATGWTKVAGVCTLTMTIS